MHGLKIIFIIISGFIIFYCTPSKDQSVDVSEKINNTEKKEFVILIRMMSLQEQWFVENIKKLENISEYNIKIATYDTFTDIEELLAYDKLTQDTRIGLIKVPYELLYSFVEKDIIMPLNLIIDNTQLQNELSEYTDISIELSTFNNTAYYIPRKLETNTLLYLKSKVNDAVNNYKMFLPEINDIFKIENGYGLPSGYILEPDPNEWDWYDLTVVAFYWAKINEENGILSPKVAHRGKLYSGTVTELATKIYQSGGDSSDLLLADTTHVYNTFIWEAFWCKNNLYNPLMWKERWSGSGIWNALSRGEVYMAFMHQLDAFFIHGVTESGMEGYLSEPDDMGTAIMPKGVSFNIDFDSGQPLFTGEHGSNLSSWWWGIPYTGPAPELSYKIARWITNYENHKTECNRFGILPIRQDIVDNLSEAFDKEWKKEVIETAYNQLNHKVITFPSVSNWNDVSDEWLNIWNTIVTQNYKNITINTEYIKNLIEPYVNNIKQLLQ